MEKTCYRLSDAEMILALSEWIFHSSFFLAVIEKLLYAKRGIAQ